VARPAAAPASALPSLEAVLRKAPLENFPVALRVLRADHREDLRALYGFARLVDDVGDEAPGDRLEALAAVERELDAAFAGRASHPVFVRLQGAIRRRDLPPDPFRDLVEANRVDQFVHRYATFDDLLGYCRLSANPVGHLVLAVFGADTPRNRRWSDAICTGLQLAEHWQDVGEDAARGRVYLPLEDLEAARCPERDLFEAPASPSVRRVLSREAARARGILDSGLPLVAALRGRPRLAVAAYLAGGRAALDALAAAGFDSVTASPRATRWARARAAAGVLVDAAGRRGAPAR
jgi:squalene synthase HpnC